MSKSNVTGPEGRETIEDPITELLRVGAQQLIQRAVETELAELLSHHGDRRTETGNAGVVRNGYLPERELQTGLGPVTVQIPKVRAKTGDPVTFRSALVPPYIRKTKSLEAAVPWLYLKGVSSGEMGDALKVLVGPQAQGLSASTVSRLKQVWAEQYRRGCEERLDADRWVYVWADGIYSGLRAEETKPGADFRAVRKLEGYRAARTEPPEPPLPALDRPADLLRLPGRPHDHQAVLEFDLACG